MATLSILNSFSMPSQGVTVTGKQGAAADATSTPFDLTGSTVPVIAGTSHRRTGVIATATVATIYDSSNDLPATFDYAHLWADTKLYVELITSATSVVIPVAAYVPFVIPGFGTMVGSAGTTAITGGTEPTCTAIAKIIIGNYSSGNSNYTLTLID